MTKTAKIIILEVALVLLILAGVFTYFINKGYRIGSTHVDNDPYSEMNMKMLLNVTCPSDVMIYGDDVDFKGIIKPRKINDLSEETLLANKNYDYRFLVIVDRDNKYDLSVDELKKAKDVILDKDNRISCYYFGKEGVHKFDEAGLVEKVYGKDTCVVGSRSYPHDDYNYRMHSEGFWTDKEEAEYKEALETTEYGFLPPEDIESGKNLLAYSMLCEFTRVLDSYVKADQIEEETENYENN